LTGAALGDRFGRRRMLVIGLVIFVAASLLAGSAPTIGVLVAARAMQGAGLAVIALFVLWERRSPHPMLSLAMFRRGSFAAANGTGPDWPWAR